jgi:tRNA/tmRNA/rRNA uracil-C5-methylase (TrmA/RlmC/RlmD family)
VHYSLDTFFQANVFILPVVFERLRQLPIWQSDSVFFDLYGGVGLFGIGVYDLVKRVVNIEENPASIRLALYNKQYNQLSAYDCYAGRLEEVWPRVVGAYKGLSKIVMVDPPRAGLSSNAVDWINQLDGVSYLLYLSCHPESLVENLKEMRQYWQVQKIIPFDFFPRTRHIETLVILKSHTIV